MTPLEQAEEAAAKALFLSWQEPQDENEVRRWTQVWDNNKERDPREYDPSVIFALKAADAAMSAAHPILALALIEKHRALEAAEARLALLESVLAEAKRECIMTPFCAAKIDATDAAQENEK